jgi:hypothetical protein
VIGELERYPLFIEIIISMFSYLSRISNSKDILLSEALSVSKLLYDQNKKSWYSTILSLLKYLKLDLRFVMNSKTNLKHLLYTKLKSNYNRHNNFDTERASDKRMSLLLDIRFK